VLAVVITKFGFLTNSWLTINAQTCILKWNQALGKMTKENKKRAGEEINNFALCSLKN
jgi:hypothetical protein